MQDSLLEAIIAEAKLKAELSAKNSSNFRNSLPPFFDHPSSDIHPMMRKTLSPVQQNDTVGHRFFGKNL